MYYYLGVSIFPSKDITAHFYDLSMLPTYFGMVQRNYSEGYYPDGDYTISPDKAEQNKFDKILELLGARPGDIILDMGCGTGTFGSYCKSKNIQVIGMTLSEAQRSICASQGLETYVMDFTVFHPRFVNKVDHVVILGSSEHIEGGPLHKDTSFKNKYSKMMKVLDYCKKYMRSDLRPHRVFYSALHMNDNEFNKKWQSYVLQRAYGGTFMHNSPRWSIQHAGESLGYETRLIRDSTKEYYLATVLDPSHFGNPSCWYSPLMVGLLMFTLVYPFSIYMYIYAVCGLWMWMFDGKLHFCHNKNYTLQEESKRPCSLVWYVGEINRSV
jgi:SAM-dependent methyltransferase